MKVVLTENKYMETMFKEKNVLTIKITRSSKNVINKLDRRLVDTLMSYTIVNNRNGAVGRLCSIANRTRCRRHCLKFDLCRCGAVA